MSIGRSLAACAIALSLAPAARGEVPRVAADIAPVQGLVARVMDGLGAPAVVVQPGGSPHSYAMRPSEARLLDQADAVFWIGPELTPWLGDTIDTLASDAEVIELLKAGGMTTLEFRQDVAKVGPEHDAGGHDHGDAHDHDGDEHGDHDGHAHDHDSDEHGDHAHAGLDPHAWLDPENGKVWLDLIADELAALDPGNAEIYRRNAAQGQEEIDAAMTEAREALSGAGPIDFVVFHDAYHYFENRFGLSASGAISLSDASDPSPARLEDVRDTVRDLGVDCVFAEPQFDRRLVETVLDGTDAKVGVIDPLGFEIAAGPDFYPRLMQSIADAFVACAS